MFIVKKKSCFILNLMFIAKKIILYFEFDVHCKKIMLKIKMKIMFIVR